MFAIEYAWLWWSTTRAGGGGAVITGLAPHYALNDKLKRISIICPSSKLGPVRVSCFEIVYIYVGSLKFFHTYKNYCLDIFNSRTLNAQPHHVPNEHRQSVNVLRERRD